MISKDTRAQRLSGEPDPVARRISTDLDAPRSESDGAEELDALISPEEASERRAAARAHQVDLATGEEFLEAEPGDAGSDSEK